MTTYEDRADFVTVYIEEAHASDEWPIGSRISYVQPRSDHDRIMIAKDFIRETNYRVPLVIDPVSGQNQFSRIYCPWPLRFYIVDSKRDYSFIAQPVNGSYSLEVIRDALDQTIRTSQ